MTDIRLLLALAGTAALAACGGSGNAGGSASAGVPASALATPASLVQWAKSVPADDDAEPFDLGDAALPTSDTDEPEPLG